MVLLPRLKVAWVILTCNSILQSLELQLTEVFHPGYLVQSLLSENFQVWVLEISEVNLGKKYIIYGENGHNISVEIF